MARRRRPPPGDSPTVTINQSQSPHQSDPTGSGPILFTVKFNQPVIAFDERKVSFVGSTAGAFFTAAVSGIGPVYTVAVTGMTSPGTVVASVPAHTVVSYQYADNLASTSTDNVVTFDNVAPTVTINQAAGQADPTGVTPDHVHGGVQRVGDRVHRAE